MTDPGDRRSRAHRRHHPRDRLRSSAPGSDDVYVRLAGRPLQRLRSATRSRSPARPTAGGRWSTPVRISTRRTIRRRSRRRSGSTRNGNIGVTYYDFRNNDPATPALETDVWFTRSTDGGANVERGAGHADAVRHADSAGRARILHGRLRGPDRPRRATVLVARLGVARARPTRGRRRLTSPFAGPTYTPSTEENNSPPAKAFPVAKGRPARPEPEGERARGGPPRPALLTCPADGRRPRGADRPGAGRGRRRG